MVCIVFNSVERIVKLKRYQNFFFTTEVVNRIILEVSLIVEFKVMNICGYGYLKDCLLKIGLS